jgi:hypothetical protein
LPGSERDRIGVDWRDRVPELRDARTVEREAGRPKHCPMPQRFDWIAFVMLPVPGLAGLEPAPAPWSGGTKELEASTKSQSAVPHGPLTVR